MTERQSVCVCVCAAAERFLVSAGWTDYLKLRGEKKYSEREYEKRGQKGHSDLRAEKERKTDENRESSM